ncbi:MAG: DEAD/DEAH box helicase family protein [Anaerolineales bacterium]|nr:DEAD/DEAH box helicase family protein [Anaerolineales bacterium]
MELLKDHPFRIYYSSADNALNNFYIPALSCSVQYDRSAGFFNSTALAVAAAGVAHLVQNGGRMRLLVGAAMEEKDVEAIRKGHNLAERITQCMLERFPDPEDALIRQRLEVLAWMVADGTLEIKVVLPRDEQGHPIPAHLARDYYHPKTGIFTDSQGNQIAFSGSVNESAAAWLKNYESFSVYFSWDKTLPYLKQVSYNFDRLWNDKETNWIALDIPFAVKERLLSFRPHSAPERDPLELEAAPQAEKEQLGHKIGVTPAERISFQFLRDAPYLINAQGLGAATCSITPWPHQSRVADTIMERYPDRAMLCDEVGLGKTIEAGLVLRQFLISGQIKRCLILAPKSVLKQWQEELYEKFALDIPRYDSGKFWDVQGQALPQKYDNPWDAHDVFLASSQLAKRSDRREQILDASGWDLLLVDEAHHARRKDFKERIYRPNQLLSLLNDLRDRVGSILLMTATPMQIHPLEVWDLLSVLGLGGRWGADENDFLNFFTQMRQTLNEIEWEFVFDMVEDALRTGVSLDRTFGEQAESELGPVKWAMLNELPFRSGQRKKIVAQLGTGCLSHVYQMARRHTPLNRFIFRNTRDLLREYEKRGIMNAKVPVRKPKIQRIPMRHEERELYDRIDEYITHFYHKYENERRGLGFVMTVYRRRLTSSFYAVRLSLERRLAFLKGQISPEQVYLEDDIEQDELDLDVTEGIKEEDGERFLAELEYVEDFIQDLKIMSVADSKLETLKVELNTIFRSRPTVLVFTQYTDTMDYLRDHLVQVYGSQVACYSGRGGEVYNGIGWVLTLKEQVKTDFRQGSIRILLCTESASEGLNLQTCGVLINYDMPWNPMRVEQRIGRIDRIGQEFDEVWISNYFYQDTIEDLIYQRLADRINWFEVVVGDLQPILAEVGEVTRRLAMTPVSKREVELEKEIELLKDRLAHREIEALNLDTYLADEFYQSGSPPPVTLQNLEQTLVHSQATGWRFDVHPEIDQAYLLEWEGQRLPVTFSPACFDAHPDTVRFLTFGNSLLYQILESIQSPEKGDIRNIVRFQSNGNLQLRGWYAYDEQVDEPQSIETWTELQEWLSKSKDDGSLPEKSVTRARELYKQKVAERVLQQEKVLKNRRMARYLTERARAKRLLLEAAMVEIALGQSIDFFDKQSYPSTFTEQAVTGLQRHGFPWGAIISLVFEPGLAPSPDDGFYIKISNDSRESLKGRFTQLAGAARKTIKMLSKVYEVLQEDPSRQFEIDI